MDEPVKNRKQRRQKVGTVVSDRMDKTIVVRIEGLMKHPLYGRMIKTRSKFKVHDEQNQTKIGDKVRIVETHPISKEKHWRLVEIFKKEK